MKKRKIGIILTTRTQECIEGYLAYLHMSLYFDEDGRICVNDELLKRYFKLQMGRRKILTVASDINKEQAKEIGKELKKIGFKSIVLCFKDEEIPI